MATELLQDREGLSVSAQLGQEYLQTGIASFEEVEEIVKSNLWKISDLTHDENAQDGFPDHDDGYDDLLGMLNLQSSDLEEKDSTESNSNEKILTKDGGKNKNFSNVEVTTESSEMPQSFKDLLDDITLVINSDKNFSNNHHHVVSKTEGLQRDSKEILASVQASRTLNKESITMSSMKIPCNAECPVKGLDNYSRVLNQGNLDQTEPLSAKDVYFEKNLSDLLGGDNFEVLTTPHEHNIDQEDLLEVPESLVSMLESSLVKLSCGMSPGKLFRDMDGTVEVTADSRLANQACDDNDVTVDGEGGDSLDEISLELCQLSYDENLTCSFYEQLQLTNDNDELLEHGQRGRPSRQKVTRQAVPCKIEPKVSQMGLQPAFFPPHLFSSTFQNIPPGVTSVVPSQLQPHLGQETLRFPVLLHRDTSRPGQLYLQVCPDIAQLTPPSQASGLSSTSQGDRHSPKGNSDQSCLSSKKEVTPEKSNLGPSTDTSSYFPDDRPVVNQTNLSLEIDGPIRRQTSLNQGRHCGSRNDPYFRVTTGSSDHAVGSLLEEPYRMQTVQENQSSAMSSQNLVPAGSYQNFVPSSFVSSSQNLMRVQDASGFGGNLQHGVPYISTGVQGSLYQHNQGLPVPVTIANYGAHDQSSQFPLPTNIHHYAPGSSASNANSCSHHFSQHSNGQAMGHWTSEPNINNAAFSVSHCLGNNNPPMHTMTSGAVPYARTNSPGLPNIPADPRSLRVRMLMAMGSQGLRQVRVNSGSSDIHSTTMPQNVARFPAPNSEDNSSMIQLSPPVELRKPQFVNQQPVNAPVTAHTQSSGAAADGSVINKSVFHPKSAPSQSSTRSSKGPDLPVPVERSKARVEQWLSNLEMFRPNLDSGTFDPSDYSLVNEPSIPHTARQYPEAAGSERSLSDKSYECIGLFEGKRMTVTPPQPSPKQKGNKRTGAVNPHGKGLSLGQIGQNRYSIISDASLLTESSLNSGQTNSSKDKYADNKNDASSDCQGKSTGRRPVHAEVPISTCAKFNQEHPQIRQIPHEDLPMSTQSVSSYPANHLDENQQADLAIAEDIKQLEQKSFEKQLAGIPSSTNSGHVLNELEQFLRSDMKSSSGGTGNHQGSSFKLEAVAAGSSKPSSFDTSKYITPSDIESLEKKKTQNGKSSLDNYLPVRCFSNENMHTEQNTSNQGDGKQLMNIPLNDIDDLIGLQRELGQQPSRLGNVLPHLQFENRQKAVKRRPADHSDEAASYQMGQTAAVGGQNAAAGERNVVFSGRDVLMGGQHVVGEQKVVLGGLQQNAVMGAQSRTVGGQNATASGQNTAAYGQNTTICGQNTEVSGQNAAVGRKSVTNMMQNNKMSEMLTSVHGRTQTGKNIFAECLTMVTQNFGDQSYLVFSEQGRIHQTVVGPPSQQPDFLMKKSSTQYPNFQIPSTTPSGPTQAKPTYEPAASQTSHSGKMQPDFQLPDFSDGYYETEMHSSPSSVEILKESTPSFNNEHFTLADSAGNQLVPVSALSHTQHLMQPLSNHSVITSASVLTNTHFKKPQNPGSSSSSSSTTHRAAGPNYPSVGDSDVSMSSDTSLPNSVMLHDGSMDPKNQIDLPQLSPQQHCEQYSAQFQQINPPQPVQKMLHSTQQQVQNQKQQQLLNQQHCLQLEKNQHQKQLLLEQQNHLQMEQSQQQQQMDSQQRCLQMQTQQQITNQDYFQMLKKQQQMPNQQTLQFQTQHQMQQQHQVIRNSHHHCEKNQQKEPQQQLEEFLIQQQQPTQQMQFYQMQIQQQQQILKQGKHPQQQLTNQENQQIQNHQQHLRLQNQQHIHLQQLQMLLPETPPSNLLQNQQQMQQYQQVLNQQQYQQMQVQQLQQPQMQKQQQKQTENQQLQQQQKLYQQLQEQSLGHCSTFTTACVPQKSSGSQAGSSCSDPQSCRVLPGTKLKERSVSQISDSVYSQQLGNLSPTSENAHDLSNSIADNDLALVPQRDRHLTSSSNQSGHGKNIFNNMHTNSLSEHYQQVGLQNCSQPASGNHIPTNTLASIQQSSSHNLEIAEQDQVLKSATETQLQKYLKEGFPSLNSVEYCQDAFAVSPFLPANIPSLTPDQPQQSLAKIGQGLDSGDGSSDKSNRLHSAERSREQADSDLSVFSLGSGEDLLSFQQDNDGETPLHLLSELPKEGISSLPSMPGFYEALNLQNKNQETALDIAVKNQNLDAVRFLVSHGADVNIFCLSSQKGAGSKTVHRNETVQQTALHEAVELGNKEIVEVLLTSQNVKVDIRRPDSGLTPLMLALQLHQPHRQSDRKEIITQLINHQASLSLHDTIQGKTPLMFAIQSRDVSLVEDILQKVGAERARALLNDRAKKDMTCLHFAAELRLESSLKKRLLRCIIVAGGDPSSKNSEGETPRDWARADINEVLQNLARLYNS